MTAALVAVAIRILANPLGAAFQKRLTARERRPIWVNFATFAFLAAVCAFPASAVDWGRFSLDFWKNATLMGVFCAVGNGCLAKALQLGELSVLGPINAWKSVVGLIFAFVLLGETPSFAALCGVATIIVGSYWILDAGPERFSWRRAVGDQAIRFRVAALILAAIEAVYIKRVATISSPTEAFFVWAIFGAIFSIPTLLALRVDVKGELVEAARPRNAVDYCGAALCVGAMQTATNVAFTRLDVGCALALFQLSALVGVLLGGRLFHEKNVGKKLFGASIIVVGAASVVLFG